MDARVSKVINYKYTVSIYYYSLDNQCYQLLTRRYTLTNNRRIFMQDDVAEILDRLKIDEFWYLDSMRYSVTLDEAALACVGITPLNREGEEDRTITYGEVMHALLLQNINNCMEQNSLENLEENLDKIQNEMLQVREIYADMRKDLKDGSGILDLDEYETKREGRPYVSKISVHTWAEKKRNINLVGWQGKQAENQNKAKTLKEVKSNKQCSFVSPTKKDIVIGALVHLWLNNENAPPNISKGNHQPNVSSMGRKIEAFLKNKEITTLTSSTIRQLLSGCSNEFNKSDGVDTQEFIKSSEEGLQQLDDESVTKP